MEQNFEYFAFISYKREDEKWAKWLQRKLEHYKLPSIIAHEKPYLPKRLNPIFRDITDIKPGVLADVLTQNLQNSKYLIVICSPRAAMSPWVGKEIEEFISRGRRNNIILFIAEGIPYSNNPDLECYHPAIKEKLPEMLGVNVHEIGKESKYIKKQKAFIRIVSVLLDVSFDSLWQRQKRRIRRRLIILATSFFFITSTTLFYIYGFQITNVRYYKGYIRQFGVIQGLNEIDKSQVEKRMSSFKFSSYGRFGKPFQVDIIDGAGNPSQIDKFSAVISNSDKENSIWATTMKLKYDQNGNILEELVVDGKGSIYLDFLYIDYNLAAYVDGGFVTQQSIKGASYVQFTRDKLGVETESKFFDQNRQPTKNNEGVYGERISYKTNFSEVMITGIDQKGNPMENEKGYVSVRIIYDSTGNTKRIEYLNYENKLVNTTWGYSTISNDCDENGNIIISLLLDNYGRSILTKDGIKGIEFHCSNGIFRGVTYIK